jgi:VanZ family protein
MIYVFKILLILHIESSKINAMKIGILVFLLGAMFVGQTWRTNIEAILRHDLLLHFICYFFAAIIGFIIPSPCDPTQICVAVWLFGLAMEFWQLWIGRGFGFDDLVANSIGITVAFATQYFLKQ